MGMITMLGSALRLVREFHGLGLTEAAARLELSKSYVSEIESGQKTPTLKVLEKYSEIFEIPVSSILFFSETIKEGEGPIASRTRQFLSKKILQIMNKFSDGEPKKI
jgi:transcriptional regulator with XRE-family HTH domain